MMLTTVSKGNRSSNWKHPPSFGSIFFSITPGSKLHNSGKTFGKNFGCVCGQMCFNLDFEDPNSELRGSYPAHHWCIVIENLHADHGFWTRLKVALCMTQPAWWVHLIMTLGKRQFLSSIHDKARNDAAIVIVNKLVVPSIVGNMYGKY